MQEFDIESGTPTITSAHFTREDKNGNCNILNLNLLPTGAMIFDHCTYIHEVLSLISRNTFYGLYCYCNTKCSAGIDAEPRNAICYSYRSTKRVLWGSFMHWYWSWFEACCWLSQRTQDESPSCYGVLSFIVLISMPTSKLGDNLYYPPGCDRICSNLLYMIKIKQALINWKWKWHLIESTHVQTRFITVSRCAVRQRQRKWLQQGE